MLRLSTSLAVASIALPAVEAILVAPDSPCSRDCGNVLISTSPDDLVCNQADYSGGSGQVFEQCLSCELSSDYENQAESQTDTQWMLYNLRYAVSYCLFGKPENDNVISTPCVTSKACGPFKDAIEFKNLSSDINSYDYCALWPVNDVDDFNGCKECLRVGDQEYLANFVTVLQAGCEQQPAPGLTVALEGDVFSTDNVNGTDPTTNANVNPDWFEHGPLTLGAKVGIAIGGFVFILAILGFCIVWNGKRRRRAFLRTLEAKHGHKGWPSPAFRTNDQGDMRETPLSQRPLRGWDDSPMTANTDKTFPRYISPYSSQYNSPVSAQDGPSMPWPDAAHAANQSIGLAISPDGGNWDRTTDYRDKAYAAESYEMHEVDSAGSENMRGKRKVQEHPPVLSHPGYGRKENSPPRTYALGEEDARAGGAF